MIPDHQKRKRAALANYLIAAHTLGDSLDYILPKKKPEVWDEDIAHKYRVERLAKQLAKFNKQTQSRKD